VDGYAVTITEIQSSVTYWIQIIIGEIMCSMDLIQKVIHTALEPQHTASFNLQTIGEDELANRIDCKNHKHVFPGGGNDNSPVIMVLLVATHLLVSYESLFFRFPRGRIEFSYSLVCAWSAIISRCSSLSSVDINESMSRSTI
jgi:hypothetical protein